MQTGRYASFLLLGVLITCGSAMASRSGGGGGGGGMRTCYGTYVVKQTVLGENVCRERLLDECRGQSQADCGSSSGAVWLENYETRTVWGDPPSEICNGNCVYQCLNYFFDGDCFSASLHNCNSYCNGLCVLLGQDYPHCIYDHCYGCSSDPSEPGGNDGCCSPVLISIENGAYQLTSWEDGVFFDLNGDGLAELTGWTSEDSDDAFLVLDRNGNGTIDDYQEVFGERTDQAPSSDPNGFRALALFDESSWGGNEDDVISAEDGVYELLELWFDRNHNGVSEPDELSPVSEFVSTIDLDYSPHRRVDGHGNEFRYRTKAYLTRGNVRHAYDVFFVHAP